MQWDFHKRFQFLRIRFVSILVSHMFGNWNFQQFDCLAFFSIYWRPLKLLIRQTFHFHKDWINLWQLFQRIHDCFPNHMLWVIYYSIYDSYTVSIYVISYELYNHIRRDEWKYSLMNPLLLLFWSQFFLAYLNLKVLAWSQWKFQLVSRLQNPLEVEFSSLHPSNVYESFQLFEECFRMINILKSYNAGFCELCGGFSMSNSR